VDKKLQPLYFKKYIKVFLSNKYCQFGEN